MESLDSGLLIGLVISMGIYWVVYSVVLLVLMKVQGWQVGMIAMLGSTALATALGQIPVVGPFVGTAVLAICIWKASGSDLTDSIFSVVIAGALMFMFQMFALTALMGNISPAWLEKEAPVLSADGFVEVEPTASWQGPDNKGDALLFLKGITLSSNQHMVLVGSGTAHYPFTNGEITTIPSPKGRLVVECEAIETNAVSMIVDLKGVKYRLTLIPPE